MGRAPCCDKANVKKGPWSPEEDSILKSYIEQHGTGGNWIALPQKIGLKRCGKSCRLRWLNYLRPNIKHGGFSQEEDNIICSLYINIGSRWSIIAAQLPGRTDNDIKNYWNTRLKNKLLGKQRKNQQARGSIIPNQAEIKKENESGTFDLLNPEPGFIMNQTRPYWADMSAITMPVLDPNYYDSQALKDQNSLKNLLFKLGGKFSESNSNIIDFEYPIDISNCGQLDHYNGTLFNSATTSTSTTTYVHDQFDTYVQGIENLQAELNELIYVNPQPLDDQPDQGCFNGWDHMVNGSTRTSSASAENSGTTWGEINSSNNFVGPRLVSDSEIYQKDPMSHVQDSSGSAFEEYSSYFGKK